MPGQQPPRHLSVLARAAAGRTGLRGEHRRAFVHRQAAAVARGRRAAQRDGVCGVVQTGGALESYEGEAMGKRWSTTLRRAFSMSSAARIVAATRRLLVFSNGTVLDLAHRMPPQPLVEQE